MKKEEKATPKKKVTTTKKPAAKKTAAKKAPAKKKPATKKTTTAKPKPVPKIEKIITPSEAELMCQGVNPRIRKQAVTLAESVLTLQNKIIQQTPAYEKAPLFQEVTVNTGETVLRANPLVQEFRATVRDYDQALKSLNELLIAQKGTAEESPLDALKNKFKIG